MPLGLGSKAGFHRPRSHFSISHRFQIPSPPCETKLRIPPSGHLSSGSGLPPGSGVGRIAESEASAFFKQWGVCCPFSFRGKKALPRPFTLSKRNNNGRGCQNGRFQRKTEERHRLSQYKCSNGPKNLTPLGPPPPHNPLARQVPQRCHALDRHELS